MAKRRFPRYQKNLLVNISSNGFDGLGLIMNLSRRGVCVQSPQLFDPDTRLALIMAAGNELIPLIGIVVWSHSDSSQKAQGIKGGMGIQIKRPPREYLKYLAQFSRMQ
ncbi:MAG: PilZ domain-containing protein [Candidatus Aminicenantes bacterium]|nr:PilZ domain-containing protein [Candidatus Aminicenantes bacterium]